MYEYSTSQVTKKFANAQPRNARGGHLSQLLCLLRGHFVLGSSVHGWFLHICITLIECQDTHVGKLSSQKQ